MSDENVPPATRLVRDFINTREPQTGEELLTSPAALRVWLTERQLGAPDGELTDGDLAVAISVREGLRAVLLEHAGHDRDPAAVSALNDALARLPVRVKLTANDFRLVGAADTVLGTAMGELLDAIRQGREDGSWSRLKVCARDTCRWAFYDASRNQVRRWCSMAGCGNHVKMQRAYATRKRRDQESAS